MFKMFAVVTSEGKHMCFLAYSPCWAIFSQHIYVTLECSLAFHLPFNKIHMTRGGKEKEKETTYESITGEIIQLQHIQTPEYSIATFCQ